MSTVSIIERVKRGVGQLRGLTDPAPTAPADPRGPIPEGAERRDLELPDGSVTPIAIYRPAGDPDGAVVVWPGFGMGGRYYRPLAEELAARGHLVLVGELRGQGGSNAIAERGHRWGYADQSRVEYARTEQLARELAPGVPVRIIAHSMGGQITCAALALGTIHPDGCMFVGSGTPWFRNFAVNEKRRLLIGAPVMRIVSRVLGYWPEGTLDIAGYGRQSWKHLREWSTMALTGRFEPEGRDISEELAAVETPLLFTRFRTDADCTLASAKDLARRMGNASAEELPEKLGHNKWAREPKATVDRFERFITETTDGTWRPNAGF